MKRFLLFIIVIICAKNSQAQDFSFSAGDTLVKTFEIHDYSWVHTKIMNAKDTSVIFKWELITFDHPEGWEFSICDLPYCYTMGETSGTMLPAAALSEDAFMNVNIEATYPDTGFYQLVVYDELFPDAKDTLTAIMIATPRFSSLDSFEDIKVPFVYYNENVNRVIFNNPTDISLDVVIFNFYGQQVLQHQLQPFEKSSVYLPHLKNGVYLISYQGHESQFEVGKLYVP